MRVVGIKQLNARLSEYIRLAKAGETVLVTERDEVVAEVHPSRRQTPVADRLEERARSVGRGRPGGPAKRRLGLAQPRSGPAVWSRTGSARRIAAGALLRALMTPGAPLYLDTSVALRATLEQGTTPDIENCIAAAPVLVTSRLSLVESARALLRLRILGGVPEIRLADARREIGRPQRSHGSSARPSW